MFSALLQFVLPFGSVKEGDSPITQAEILKRFKEAEKLPFEPAGVRDEGNEIEKRVQENILVAVEASNYIQPMKGGLPKSKVPTARTLCLLPPEKEVCAKPREWGRTFVRLEYKELVFAPFESLYKAHLHNLMYMNLEGLYP